LRDGSILSADNKRYRMKQKNRSGKFASMLTLAIVLMLPLTSCQSSPEVVTEIETVVPPLTFPLPPDPAGFVVIDPDTGDVIVDVEWWVQLAEYMADVEAVRKQYQLYRQVYE
jgi:hypothetical protein